MPSNAVRSVQEVFREFVLTIPDYQRGYAWERKQVEDFLEDLDLLSEGKAHYTGTLILHPAGGDPSVPEIEDASGTPFRLADVVDGQQRLTTIVILLAAIARRIQREGQHTLAEGLRQTFIASETSQRQPLLKLRLNHDSRAYWERNILADEPGPDPPSIVSHRRLLAARQQVDGYLDRAESELDDDYLPWLNRLREKVVKQLRLTVYEVDDAAEVGVIFETQNDRGRPLTDLEKTKNLLLYLAAKIDVPHHGLAPLVNVTWTKLLQALSGRDLARSDDEDALLRCHWLIFHDPHPREWHGFDTVKAEFSLRRYKSKQAELAGVVRTYLQTLGDCVGPYCDVMAPGHTSAFASWSSEQKLRNEVIDYSDKLRRIGAVANLVPLLVACRLRNDFGPAEYLRILKSAEVFAFRSRVVRARSDAGQASLFPLANRVQREEADVSEVLSTIRDASARYASAPAVRVLLGSIKTDFYRWPLIKYILFEYELYRAGTKHPPAMTWERIEGRTAEQTIEHILPQTPSDPYWQVRFDTSAQARWTDDLGNLCLTYDNSSYRNKGFPEKRGIYGQSSPCYANSPLYQEKDLSAFDEWTPETVKDRRERLLSFIWERWEVEAFASAERAAADLVEQLIGDDAPGTITISDSIDADDAQPSQNSLDP